MKLEARKHDNETWHIVSPSEPTDFGLIVAFGVMIIFFIAIGVFGQENVIDFILNIKHKIIK